MEFEEEVLSQDQIEVPGLKYFLIWLWDIFSSTTDLYLKSLCFNYQYLQERYKNILKHEVIDSFHLCWLSQLLSVMKSFMQLITRFH